MARYSAYLGRKVEVHYRAGDILLPASGTFVADSGRSIFLEQHMIQRGQQKHFRWEIPYQYIVNLHEIPEQAVSKELSEPAAPAREARAHGQTETLNSGFMADQAHSVSKAAKAAAAEPTLTPLQNRPKPA